MQPDEQARLFLQYDYVEMKSLCTQFLTVVVSVLVFSLTFSEKIADFHKATKAVKWLLLAAWFLFFTAIVLGGLAIYHIAFSGGAALASNALGYRTAQAAAMTYAISGGCCFVSGLMAMMLSAMATVLRRKEN